MIFKKPDIAQLIRRLERPKGKVRMVLDTDAYNEADDQFALSYAVRLADKLQVEAFYAAPFYNRNSSSPEDGMEKSYAEILHLKQLLGKAAEPIPVFRGSRDYLKDGNTPQPSEAAEDLVRRAMEMPEGESLYVVAIGAITNVASAILMEPAIIDKIVVVWLGGHARHWPDTREFNLWQDVHASRILFNCGVPLVQLPCMGVVSQLMTTDAEMREQLAGKNALCDYLCNYARQEGGFAPDARCWSRVIWDVSTIAWLAGPAGAMDDVLVSSPLVSTEGTYSFDERRHPIRYVTWLDRDRIFQDLYAHLQKED